MNILFLLQSPGTALSTATAIILHLLLLHLRLDQRARIPLPATGVPPHQRGQQDRRQKDDRPVHVLARHGPDGRQQEDDTDKQRPSARPDVHENAVLAHVPGSRLEAAEHDLAEDGDAVRPVERDSRDVEHASDGRVRAEADEVDRNAPEDGDPDGEDGGAGALVDLGPVLRPGDELVAGEGEEGAGQRLGRGEADELQDDEGADGVEDAAGAAEGVVVDLRDGLVEGGGENGGWVAHDEDEHDVEKETCDVGEKHGHGDRPGRFDFGLVDPVLG